jgi:hypothetical protein
MTEPLIEGWVTTHIRIPEYPGAGRLGRHVRHDSRSLAYRYGAQAAAEGGAMTPVVSVAHVRNIPILDQGNLGSCTGNAADGALGTDPLYEVLPPGHQPLDEAEAIRLYSDAEMIDGGQGYPPEDQGSSGLSVAQAARNLGLISGYTHCLSLADFLAALQDGPVLLGTNWYDSMDTPDSSGLVTISPNAVIRGGHEIVARALDVTGQLVGLDNSWGTGWGVHGSFSMSYATLERLLSEEGDGTVLVPLSQPAPVPVPVPVPPTPPPSPMPPGPNPADVTLARMAEEWVQHRHEGANHRMADGLIAWMNAHGF